MAEPVRAAVEETQEGAMNRPLSVVLVHWTAPPTTGGVESHLRDLARFLDRLGCTVAVVTGEAEPAPIPGVRIASLPLLQLERVRADLARGQAGGSASYREAFAAILGELAPDVVHGHNLHHFTPGPALALDELRHTLGFGLHHTFHETWPDILAATPVYRDWEGNYAVSRHVRAECESRIGFAPDLLELGIDTELFAPRDAGPGPSIPVILHPARLLPWKGVHVSVQMLAILARQGVGCRLVLTDTTRIADWEDELLGYRQRVAALSRELGVADRIEFRAVRYEDMPRLYAEADVVVYPTVGEEPYGLVPLEAMSCERPVVVSRSGGMVETVIDGKTGYVVERDDPVGLAKQVAELLTKPQRARAMGRAGRAHVTACFDGLTQARRLLASYRSRQNLRVGQLG
jgi:glycosyltransferase involved in cell wall biosynthesis